MRLVWILIVAVVVCALLLWLLPSFTGVAASPPGQYPLHEPRPAWSVTHVTAAYRPSAAIESTAPPFAKDAKFQCGTSSVCPAALETVNLDI